MDMQDLTHDGHVRLVYLAGMGRSGSTLLDRLLDQLDGWASLGEVVHLWHRSALDDERCGCGERFSSCPTWSAIGEAAFGSWSAVDISSMQRLQGSVERDRHLLRLARPERFPAFKERLAEWNDVMRRILAAAHEVTGASVLVDSSKHVSSLMARSHMVDATVVPVHILRDSRGVAYSWTKSVARASADNDVEMSQWSPLETSLRYAGYGATLAAAFPNRVQVKYEHLVEDPVGQVARVAATFDHDVADQLAWDGTAVNFGRSHGLSGNPMRHRDGRIELRRDDAWRTKLAPGDRRLVTALTLPSLLAAGYPVRRPRLEP